MLFESFVAKIRLMLVEIFGRGRDFVMQLLIISTIDLGTFQTSKSLCGSNFLKASQDMGVSKSNC